MEQRTRGTIIASLLLVTGLASGQSGSAPPPPPAEPPAAGAPAPTPEEAPPEPPHYSDVALTRGLSKEDIGYSPAESTEATLDQLEELGSTHTGLFQVPFFTGAIGDIHRALNELHAKTGLRISFAYTTVFQQASGGFNGFGGDFDIMTAWTLVGRGTANTGTLVVTGEDRFRQADQPPSALRGDLGTLQPPTNGFNDRGWVVRDALWMQRLFDGRLRFLIGRADLTDYVGAHRLQNKNNSFSNRFFSANPTVASPGHGPAFGISVVPNDLFYVNFGLANAYGTTTTMQVSSLDQGDFFYTLELGFTPEIEGLGTGRYQLMLWQMDGREELGLPSDSGVSVILNQDIGEQFLCFARYGYSEATLSNIQNSVQAGVGYRGLFGPDNLTGFAGSWGEPPTGGGRNETVFEIFQRIQLTAFSQLTVGGQVIIDPANSPWGADVVGVLTARYRIAF
jgi:porin